MIERLFTKFTSEDALERYKNFLDAIASPLCLISWLPFISMNVIFFNLPTDPNEFDVTKLLSVARIDTIACVIFATILLTHSIINRNKVHLSKMPHLLFVALYLVLATLDFFSEYPIEDYGIVIWVLLWVYAILTLATTIAFGISGNLSNGLTLIVIGILGFEATFLMSGVNTPIFSMLVKHYTVSPISCALFLSAVYFIRMLFKIYQDNDDLVDLTFGEHSDERTAFTGKMKEAAKLWSPMPIIFLMTAFVYWHIGTVHIAPNMILYLDRINNAQDPTVATVERQSAAPRKPSIDQALTDLVDRSTQALQDETNRVAESVRKNAILKSNEVGLYLRAELPLRLDWAKTQPCTLLGLFCYFENSIKSMMDIGYQTSRDRVLKELDKKITSLDGTAEEYNEKVANEIVAHLGKISSLTKQSIHQIAQGILMFRWVTLMYSILILLKSYLIVLARTYYSDKSANPYGHERIQPGAQPAIISIPGDQFTISQDETETQRKYYISPSACGLNVVDRKRIPQVFRLISTRLLAGNYFMCKIDLGSDPDVSSCDIKLDQPAQIVRWEIAGTKSDICLNMHDVVGFSEGCTLGRHVSFKLSSLILGRVFYHTISGPKSGSTYPTGVVFLRTASTAFAGSEDEANQAVPSSGLIAWNKNARFKVVSSLTRRDVFFSGYSLRKSKAKNDQIVFDTSQSRRSETAAGIFRLTRTFLLPF